MSTPNADEPIIFKKLTRRTLRSREITSTEEKREDDIKSDIDDTEDLELA